MTKQIRERTVLIISAILVVTAIVASYAHRLLVVDNRLNNSPTYFAPVVTDTVIPATGPIHQFANVD